MRFPTALLVLSTLAIAAGAEAGKRPAAPTFLELTYCWDAEVVTEYCDVAIVQLNADGTLESEGESGTWTNRRGVLTLTWPGQVVYVGDDVGGACYEGTMEATSGVSGVWEGCQF